MQLLALLSDLALACLCLFLDCQTDLLTLCTATSRSTHPHLLHFQSCSHKATCYPPRSNRAHLQVCDLRGPLLSSGIDSVYLTPSRTLGFSKAWLMLSNLQVCTVQNLASISISVLHLHGKVLPILQSATPALSSLSPTTSPALTIQSQLRTRSNSSQTTPTHKVPSTPSMAQIICKSEE